MEIESIIDLIRTKENRAIENDFNDILKWFDFIWEHVLYKRK